MTTFKGPFITVRDAANLGGITINSINSYAEKGYLELHFNGAMVYYRDVLRASWIAKQEHLSKSGKASPKFKYNQ